MYSDVDRTKKGLSAIRQKLFHRRTKRLLTDTERIFQNYLDIFTVYFIIFILLGICFASFQNVSLSIWKYVFGILLILSGIIHFLFFMKRRQFYFYRFSWIYSLVGILLGLISFFLGDIHLHLLLIFFGIYVFVSTLERLMECFYLFPLRDQCVLMLIVHAIVGVILGIFILVNPFAHLSYAEVLGIFSILFGILNLSEVSILQRRITEFAEVFS